MMTNTEPLTAIPMIASFERILGEYFSIEPLTIDPEENLLISI